MRAPLLGRIVSITSALFAPSEPAVRLDSAGPVADIQAAGTWMKMIRYDKGYNLPARHVIHTVGPVWHGGGKGEPGLLESAYRRCFEVAHQHGLTSIAFPAISAGVYGYPMREAAVIALSAALTARTANPELERIIFVQFSEGAQQVYREAAASLGIR